MTDSSPTGPRHVRTQSRTTAHEISYLTNKKIRRNSNNNNSPSEEYDSGNHPNNFMSDLRDRSVSQAQAQAQAQMPPGFQDTSAAIIHDTPPAAMPASASAPVPARPPPVTWMSLPRKSQLVVLCLCRVFDFLQIASLQAYMFYQLRSFDDGLNDAEVSTQAGILQGAFTAAQFATAIPWGRVADAPWGGRRFVLMVGLIGTAISCLGVAFATTFYQAVFWRSFGGAINGTVGIIRTMIAENVKEKRYHSRAFLILPIGFNIAALFGPVIGGLMSDPVRSYPALFGENSLFGGATGVEWLQAYPYALPMLLNFVSMVFCATLVALFLEETLEACKGRPGLGSYILRLLPRSWESFRPSSSNTSSHLKMEEEGLLSDQASGAAESYELGAKSGKQNMVIERLPFRRIWTKNVIYTLLAQAFFDFQMGAFNNLWLLFLSTPRYNPEDDFGLPRSLPFVFSGGLGMPPQSVGLATSILGVIGMLLQFTVYPKINSRLGTARSYQYFLAVFPVAYAVAPFVALAPSSTPPPAQASGIWLWLSIIVVLFLQVTARTFTLPTSIILLNNCSPHPSVLGTIHGLGQSVSSAFRTIGPVFSGSWYGHGLQMGMVGFSWWMVALVSVAGYVSAIFVYEGSGHEVFLPGEMPKA